MLSKTKDRIISLLIITLINGLNFYTKKNTAILLTLKVELLYLPNQIIYNEDSASFGGGHVSK